MTEERSIYSMFKKGEITRKEYKNLVAQRNGFKDSYEYHQNWRKNNPCYDREWQRSHYTPENTPEKKESATKRVRKYQISSKGKVATKKHKNKRKRNLGYIPLNEFEANSVGFVGHHLDKEHVLFIPRTLHDSIRHNVFTWHNMDKINEISMDWYVKYYGLM